MNKKLEFIIGAKHGIPIGIGYFAVSFGFGALAFSQGLSVFHSTLISLTNLTSAGQLAGLSVIHSHGTYLEIIALQLLINSRYALMSLALGQRLASSVGTVPRLICSFFNTDEIFALAMAREQPITPAYILGMGAVASLGWTTGTLTGGIASSLLPTLLRTALGASLYGMFIAIVAPKAKENRAILAVSTIAMTLMCGFKWLPLLNQVTPGLAIIIATAVAAALGAYFAPIKH